MTLQVKYAPPLELKADAYPHQEAALKAVKDLEYAALFHEQGLGKTKIALDLSIEWLLHDQVDSILIVTKKGLIVNWTEEIDRHTYFKPAIISGDNNASFYAFNRPARIYLTNYETIASRKGKLDLFLRTRRVAGILDEAHKIKNPDTQVAKALFTLGPKFVRRIIMTGTPVANRPYDIWAPIFFLDQGSALGSNFGDFKKRLDITNNLYKDKKAAMNFEKEASCVYEKIAAFSVRATKENTELDLPDKKIHNMAIDLEASQRDLYNKYKNMAAAEVFCDGKMITDNAEEILKRLLRLVQVASNPLLVDDAWKALPGKLPCLVKIIKENITNDSKTIIWSSFTQTVDYLHKYLGSFGSVKVHGKMSIVDRNRSIKKFKEDSERKILIATPQSAKEGLTLTVANHAVFYDRSFSLDDYLQAQDRIHRISQNRPCLVTNLVARDTIDEWIDALLSAKKLAAQLVQHDISKEYYEATANYEFGEIIRQVLKHDTEVQADA